MNNQTSLCGYDEDSQFSQYIIYDIHSLVDYYCIYLHIYEIDQVFGVVVGDLFLIYWVNC